MSRNGQKFLRVGQMGFGPEIVRFLDAQRF
jgi:hypothetical protein